MRVFIGVDPHRLSATIEVVDTQETVLTDARFETNKPGYAAMKKHVAGWPDRVWAVEGSGGAGRPLAQRLLADGERVVDVPPKLSARARLFDTGQRECREVLRPVAHPNGMKCSRRTAADSLHVQDLEGRTEFAKSQRPVWPG